MFFLENTDREGKENWEYSEKAIALIREYRTFAPDLFEVIFLFANYYFCVTH